jgi:hypothetical protein
LEVKSRFDSDIDDSEDGKFFGGDNRFVPVDRFPMKKTTPMGISTQKSRYDSPIADDDREFEEKMKQYLANTTHTKKQNDASNASRDGDQMPRSPAAAKKDEMDSDDDRKPAAKTPPVTITTPRRKKKVLTHKTTGKGFKPQFPVNPSESCSLKKVLLVAASVCEASSKKSPPTAAAVAVQDNDDDYAWITEKFRKSPPSANQVTGMKKSALEVHSPLQIERKRKLDASQADSSTPGPKVSESDDSHDQAQKQKKMRAQQKEQTPSTRWTVEEYRKCKLLPHTG